MMPCQAYQLGIIVCAVNGSGTLPSVVSHLRGFLQCAAAVLVSSWTAVLQCHPLDA